MLSRNIYKLTRVLFIFAFGAYFAAVLWITLFSRLNSPVYTRPYYPFQSYVMLLNGDFEALVQNIENCCLFFPLGIFLWCTDIKKLKIAALAGFLCSLGIELCQLVFHLGIFEPDDIMHNTLGTIIGFWVVYKSGFTFRFRTGRTSAIAMLLSTVLILSIPMGMLAAHKNRMRSYAALYNREDGLENLLVLRGTGGYAWDTQVFVSYNDDGSINISGSSDKKSWWPIADITLGPGKYIASGLDDAADGLLGISIEYYDKELHRFMELTPDIGINPTVEFELTDISTLRVYVKVYPGFDGEFMAAPVIYGM